MLDEHELQEAWQMLGLLPSPLWVPNYRRYWLHGSQARLEGEDYYNNPFRSNAREHLAQQAWHRGWEDTNEAQLEYYMKMYWKVQKST